ncbi:cytochrome c oxidase subunit II [Pseudohongiella sp. SYSU M77423]|uniref:cytochrome c oxidase subunit II n=1 Tax=unclassified Pseudohongiella TaxID=2629611 RepID=UPI001F02F5ED|nr:MULTISPECIES: cytochrome c oxidase subunit II [unclassified Pseudohongiella]MDH7944246.1 cytochrome c oxidase subunit II [Pseudohongiella sp. SYSU M77423]MEC8859698.1 cytochrome c oxidase subunit II [Pseudomonadota bacterium]
MLSKAKLWLSLAFGTLLMWSAGAHAAWELNMPRGVTQISRETYDLHMTIFWWMIAIGVVVFGVLFWSIINHRKSKGAKPATFHESTKVEIVWTLVPFLILIAMAIPATRVLTAAYDASESELDVQIIGYQWRWEYRYMDDDPNAEEVSFFSSLATSREEISNSIDKGENYLLEVDNPLVIPSNTKVRFLMTAADVLHAWWVPEFAIKKDTIPGFINESWVIVEEPGIYRGQCAELCGMEHGFMPIEVHVLEPADFEAWYAEQQQQALQVAELTNAALSMDEAMAEGAEIYSRNCVACHQANGQGMPPAFPALAGSAKATGDIGVTMDTLVNGVPGTAMAAYGRQLNPIELASIITYVRNAFGNQSGDMVQPAEVNEFIVGGQ